MRRPLGNSVGLGLTGGTMLTLPPDARDKHVYVCGATGTGKSKLLENMVRQDIVSWRKSKCGLLLLDPHGSLYDSLMSWLSWHKLDRPIIPIDLRRDDWVLAYNVLRERSANPAVVVETFVEAMAYTWGQKGTDQTPLFARWASNTMRALYENGFSLAEAQLLTDRNNQHMRRLLTANMEDPISGRDWAYANNLSPKDFEAQIGSTLNRLGRFLRNDYMRAMFGQTNVSLDLGKALEDGSIILVSLARAGGRVSKEDADLFATLLLSDLWTAAQERGKHAKNKPFYVYADEAQRFVTPSIAENLDEARGFGLHLTLANQFPGQFLARGVAGKQLYDSIMENATTKVVFRMTSEENLEPLAKWLFRGTTDPDQIKHELYSTKVMGYKEEIKTSYTKSRSEGKGGGKFEGHSSGAGKGNSMSFAGDNEEYDEEEALGRSRSSSESTTDAEGESNSWNESESESETETSVLIPILGKELSQIQYRSIDEQLYKSMQALFGQAKRNCTVRVGDRMIAPVSLEVPLVTDPPTPDARSQRYLEAQYAKWSFFVPMTTAMEQLEDRGKELELTLLTGTMTDEPTTTKRRIDKKLGK